MTKYVDENVNGSQYYGSWDPNKEDLGIDIDWRRKVSSMKLEINN